jgi:hypothetical protein
LHISSANGASACAWSGRGRRYAAYHDVGVAGGLDLLKPVAIHQTSLVQDIAHESPLKSKRQQIHARIAVALEKHYPIRAEVEPETIALHLTEAGLAGMAVDCWLRAGRR